jgi:NADPH:quinone reductase-like Zn-dependent oxidoreductase/acyl carrier protein
VVTRGDGYARVGPGAFQVDGSRREDLSRLLDEVQEGGSGCRGVVHLWSLDAGDGAQGGADFRPGVPESVSAGVLHLVQALALAGKPAPPRLWLVTAGAQAAAESEPVVVAQAPVWGLARVIRNEHPELRCTSVDLSPEPHEVDALAVELRAVSPEVEVALRGSSRRVARLAAWAPPPRSAVVPATVAAEGQPYRFEVSSPGVLDNLTARARGRRAPGPGQVEIEVAVVGLNFMNVMSALGIYPGYPNGVGPLGIECSGRIAAVGDGVAGLRVGDDVVGVAFDCLGTHAVTDARLVRRRPDGLTAEQAATVPIAFMTAWYALYHLGRLGKGETVLVHAAAGGVGQAALQLAHRAGARVLATAGTEEKRALVKSLGAAEVMDSRSLDFARETLSHTGGHGVDVVLNSLAGEAIPAGLRVLAPYGRFLEIGKRDIYRNTPVGLEPFRKNLTYAAVDLDRFIRERPEQAGALLGEVMDAVASGELQPVPHEVFPASRAAEAFRHMAQGQHTGKIVIDVLDPAVRVERAAFDGGSYLVTGGLGALGLEVARWLAAQGAPALALLGRGEPSADAAAVVDELRRGGTRVLVARADVADAAQLGRALEAVDAELPPLAGVVHAAGILDDGILIQQDATRFGSVMAPKVAGAWNLHAATAARPLQHFVLFSSVAALLGIPGQGNYAAGNAFLDALAAQRRRLGLPGCSIAWGPWSEVGLAAARSDRGQRLALQGLESLRPADGIEALALLLEARPPQVAVMPFDAARWGESLPAAAAAPLFERLRSAAGAPGQAGLGRPAGIREALLAVEPGRRRRSLLESHLQDRVAQVLRLTASRIERNKPLRTLGLDSLMALELRNRLEADLGLTLPATLVWNYPSVALLAPHLATRLQIPLDGPVEPESPPPAAPADGGELDRLLEEIQELSPEEARRLLTEER